MDAETPETVTFRSREDNEAHIIAKDKDED